MIIAPLQAKDPAFLRLLSRTIPALLTSVLRTSTYHQGDRAVQGCLGRYIWPNPNLLHFGSLAGGDATSFAPEVNLRARLVMEPN